MAVKMRLARAGTKKRPYYHIVIADAAAPRDGKFIDVVGAFNPMLKKDDANRVKLDTEKAAAWLKKGAQATDRVLRFLDKAGLVKREARNNPQKALPGKKRVEREKAAARGRCRRQRLRTSPSFPLAPIGGEGGVRGMPAKGSDSRTMCALNHPLTLPSPPLRGGEE